MKKTSHLTIPIKFEIDKVVVGNETEFVSDILSAHEIMEYLKEKYNFEQGDFDTNGWQMDFWIYCRVNGRKLCIEGSGYYGGIKISFAEDY
jgi:hypothetical protein